MRPYQILTSDIFNKIVREEIELQFKIRYYTDQRLPDLYKQVQERELEDEVYSIFFRSFDDILETIGIRNRKKLKIRTYWYDIHHVVKWYEIVEGNFPGRKFNEGEDIKFEFRMWYLYFHYKGKKYVMGLDERIKAMVDYVFTKNIFKPVFEASCGLRYKTIQERTHDGFIEWDMYTYTKIIGDNISRDLRSYEKNIWHPHFYPDLPEKYTIRIGM